MSAHSILAIIDEHKEGLGDLVYKNLCDELTKLNTERIPLSKDRYIKLTGTEVHFTRSEWYDEGEEQQMLMQDMEFTDRSLICRMYPDRVGYGPNVMMGRCTVDHARTIAARLSCDQLHKEAIFDDEHKIKGYFIITRLEEME